MKHWIVIFLCALALPAYAQDLKPSPYTSAAVRQAAVEALAAEAHYEAARAIEAASRYGWAVRGEFPGGGGYELVGVDEDGLPVYVATTNRNAAISTAADLVRNTAPYNLNGAGLIVGVWDEGSVRDTHQDLAGRVVNHDGSSIAYHSTHVAGTIAGSGVGNVAAMGMAPAARIASYNWSSDSSEMTSRGAAAPITPGSDKIYASNHSYATLTGWESGDYANTGSTSKYWFGVWGQPEARDFGRYDSRARDWDSLCYNLPYYLPFKAAANDRDDTPPGQGTTFYRSSGLGWSTETYDSAIHPKGDGQTNDGYDTVQTYGNAKNIVTMGATADANNTSGGPRVVSRATVTSYSGWGPSDDGRIKPDLVANGSSLTSTSSNGDTSYGSSSGTSMSSPNAVGSAILLQEYYARLFPGSAMLSSTLKGLLIHTADDRGNAGPDYTYGWGLINIKAAADLIAAHAAATENLRMLETSLVPADNSRHYRLRWGGAGPIRVTMCWTDPSASSLSGLDDASIRLVNDLDLRIEGPDGQMFLPYILDPASPSVPATTGDNIRDNVEEVYVASPPEPGIYTVHVTHKGSLSRNVQVYSLIMTGLSADTGEPFRLTLALGEGEAHPGQVLTVPVDLVGPNETPFAGFSFDVRFDAQKLEFLAARTGQLTPGWIVTGATSAAAPDVASVTGIRIPPTLITGTNANLVNLDFRVQPGASPGDSLLVAENVAVEPAHADVSSGTAHILEALPTPTFTITPTPTATFTPTPTGTPTPTWTATWTPTLPPPVNFDLNASGVVDAGDIFMLMEVLGESGPGMAADFNRDGRVDGRDVLLFSEHWDEVTAN